jgi:hypothetical protein
MTLRLLHLLRWLFLVTVLVGGAVPYALASDAAVQRVEVVTQGDLLLLNADVDISLPTQLENAAARGVPLFFTADVEVIRPRWYWMDEELLSSRLTWRVSQNVLTRQWRVSTGGLGKPVDSLQDALADIRRMRDWPFAQREELPVGLFKGRLRVRLDVSQLPKTFQANALNGSDWAWATPWFEFGIAVPAESGVKPDVKPEPRPEAKP